MKRAIFVIGPANSGKSFFITKKFPEKLVVDIFNFQKNNLVNGIATLESLYTAENQFQDKMIESCKEYNDVVYEHTLMKRKRRQTYISMLREAVDEKIIIDCYYSFPDLNVYQKYDQRDVERYNAAKRIKQKATPEPIEFLQKRLEEFEIPDSSDGFDHIYCIQDLVKKEANFNES